MHGMIILKVEFMGRLLLRDPKRPAA